MGKNNFTFKTSLFVMILLFAVDIECIFANPKSISGRNCHSAVYDPTNKQMIVFGGRGLWEGKLSDTWVFDIERKEWEKIKTEEAPIARDDHAAIYDSANKQMIVFGGGVRTPGKFFNTYISDTWIFNIEKKEWEEIETEKTPSGRRSASVIYDSANKQMIVFGGDNDKKGFLSDIWAFDIEKKTWEKIEVNK